MDLFTVIGIVLWIWGAYKAWGTVSARNWEWVNRQEPVSYVVKVAFCILIGFGVAAFQLAKAGLKFGLAVIRMFG